MLKEEFESRINATVDMKTYDLVNFVYILKDAMSEFDEMEEPYIL